MKYYLFDKIVIDCSTIRFYPYRSTTFLEFFTTNFCGKLENDTTGKNTLCPNNFFEFLQCLNRTKIKGNEYEILQYDTYTGTNIESTFNYLLKKITQKVYKDKPANKNKVEEFYKKAYKVRANAQQSAETLNKEPDELIK